MRIKFLTLVGTVLLMASCGQKPAPPQTVEVPNLYTIELPSNVGAMEDLYTGADLQYGNTFNQVYYVTKHDDKELTQSFDQYVEEAKATYSGRPNYKVEKEDDIVVNGLKGKILELSMTLGPDEMFMIQTIVEGTKGYYQLITWTPAKTKDVSYKGMINTIGTFKEIK